MGEVVVRNGAADVRGVPKQRGDGIRKGIAQQGSGIVVHGLAVSVIASKLEAVAQSLLDTKLSRLISGVGVPLDPPDQAEVLVGPQILLAAGGIGVGSSGPHPLSGGDLRRGDGVEIVAADDHMDAMRTYVTHRRGQGGGGLVL